MKKFVCPVCGYSVIAEAAPEKCPVCGVPGSKFKVEEVDAEMTWAWRESESRFFAVSGKASKSRMAKRQSGSEASSVSVQGPRSRSSSV